MQRKWYWIIGGVIVAVLLLVWLLPSTSEDDNAPVYYEVERGPLAIEVTTTGELRSARSEEIMGPASLRKIGIYQVKITDIIPEGTVVKEGAYVASLDKTEIANKLQELETELQLEQSKLDQAKLDTSLELSQARNQIINLRYDVEEKRLALEQSQYEPPAVIQQAENALDKAELALQEAIDNYAIKQEQSRAKVYEIQTQLNLKLSQYNQMLETLSEFTINAPKSGMLVYARDWGGRKIAVGSNVSAWNPVVATLPDLTRMISKTYVNEIDISKVEEGQRVDLGVDAFPDRKYTGVVKSVANVGQEKDNSNAKVFEVEIALNEKDTTLRPSMTTSNVIHVAEYDSVIFVPLECVHENDSAYYVFLDEGKSTVRQEIIRGAANEHYMIVQYGIDEGDRLHYSTPEAPEQLAYTPVPPDVKEEYLFKPEPLPEEEPEEDPRLKNMPPEVRAMIKAKKDKEEAKSANGDSPTLKVDEKEVGDKVQVTVKKGDS